MRTINRGSVILSSPTIGLSFRSLVIFCIFVSGELH